MASHGDDNQNQNQNQQAAGGPFDVQRFFPPSSSPSPSPPPIITNPNSAVQNPYPPPPYSYPPQTAPLYHHQFNIPPPPFPPDGNMHLQHQRSGPYPTHPLQPSSPNSNPNPNHGARLMALLSPSPSSNLDGPPQLPPPPTQSSNPTLLSSVPALHPGNGPLRMPSSKLPKGRHLVGDRVVYDIDVRLPGEVQPQLEVTPITKYGSDPGLVVGRQIAVNKTYICYGLKLGAIRVLNINTALRSLLKGLAQRVTDMAFFAEDVHVLASASMDGRVYVWKITESSDEEDKPQITGKIVTAIQVVGEGEAVHPRVCWHCHKQEVLVVGIGRRILRIDTTKVGRGAVYSAEEPLKCPVDKLIDGVQFVGNHDGEVTDLSMCQWMTTRLASASVDGTIKVWEDRKSSPIAVLRPHDGLPVNSVTFLTAPHRPDHIILITGGPLNREVKIWVSDGEEGWLLPSDADSWHCTQTLELKSSAEPRIEDAFFNQVVALSQSGLLLLANAKKNAIYAVHLEYGSNPETTRMDYITEFTVTMPILSLTGTSDLLPHGEQIVQVYCVQTQAIQQYALDLFRCLPPPVDNVVYEKTDSAVTCNAASTEGSFGLEPSRGKMTEMPLDSTGPSFNATPALRQSSSSEFSASGVESKSIPSPVANDNDASFASPPVPLSPRLSRKLSSFRTPSGGFEPGAQQNEHDDQKIVSVDRQMDTASSNLSNIPSLDDDSRTGENKVAKEDGSMVADRTIKFKHPTHLVTPAELMGTSSSERNHVTEQKSDGEADIQDVVVNSDPLNGDMDVKVVGETGSQNADPAPQREINSFASEHNEKSFSSQASDIGLEMARDRRGLPGETYFINESKQLDETGERKATAEASVARNEVHDPTNDLTAVPATAKSSTPSAKGKKQKGKNVQGSGPSSPSPSGFNSIDSFNEPGVSSSILSAETILSRIQSMQEAITQVLLNQKEIQKQIPAMVAVPVTKEGRRIEAAIGKSMEKTLKANADALWARTQEEFAKQEKSNRDRHQQISGLVTNGYKDLLATWEKILKKETAAVVPVMVRSVAPLIEKAVSTAISEAFQRGVGDKAVNQLEKSVHSKLEATVARQIQALFPTSGKQALQEALKSSMEASIIPTFEMSCKALFDQVNATFKKGMVEHATATQQQVESTHSPLAMALRDAMNSASSMTQTLSGELADGQRRLVALAVAGANSKGVNPLVTQISNGPVDGFREKIEAPVDPTKELSRLVYEHKYQEAFTAALQRSDVGIVSWLCSQVDLQGILTSTPLPLSQGVLLSLLQQLACDIGNDTAGKLGWMMDLVVAIKPSDATIAMHVRPIFDQVFSILNHQATLPMTSVAELSSIRVLLRLINSTLHTL